MCDLHDLYEGMIKEQIDKAYLQGIMDATKYIDAANNEMEEVEDV